MSFPFLLFSKFVVPYFLPNECARQKSLTVRPFRWMWREFACEEVAVPLFRSVELYFGLFVCVASRLTVFFRTEAALRRYRAHLRQVGSPPVKRYET